MPKESARLTILTDPIPTGSFFITESAKRIARSVRDCIKPPAQFMQSAYRGHFAVTRSLVEGLRKIGCPFNYNPKTLSDVADVVIVLSGVSALRQAIALKRKGMIRKLLAGPNLVTFPSDHDSIICSPEVDFCVTPGPLTCDIYTEDCPQLVGRCVGWPAGVDVEFWSPHQALRTKSVLIYDKRTQGHTDTVDKYSNWVKQHGYDSYVIEYGRYTPNEYLNALRRAALLIGFTSAESQGISWAEAWAADVPTFMWFKDRHEYNHPRSVGRTYRSSPAPYLSDMTGDFFKTWDEFTRLFSDWDAGKATYSPRSWVLAHLSDEVCAERLLKIAELRKAT